MACDGYRFVYFGFELIRAFNTVGLGGYSTVAHMAHIGSFVLAYALVPLVAKGGPYPLGVIDGGPKGLEIQEQV